MAHAVITPLALATVLRAGASKSKGLVAVDLTGRGMGVAVYDGKLRVARPSGHKLHPHETDSIVKSLR